MHKIIVTGGLGFIGSNLIELLLLKKFTVINVDKITYAASLGSLAPIENNDRNVFEQTSKETRFSNQL